MKYINFLAKLLNDQDDVMGGEAATRARDGRDGGLVRDDLLQDMLSPNSSCGSLLDGEGSPDSFAEEQDSSVESRASGRGLHHSAMTVDTSNQRWLTANRERDLSKTTWSGYRASWKLMDLWWCSRCVQSWLSFPPILYVLCSSPFWRPPPVGKCWYRGIVLVDLAPWDKRIWIWNTSQIFRMVPFSFIMWSGTLDITLKWFLECCVWKIPLNIPGIFLKLSIRVRSWTVLLMALVNKIINCFCTEHGYVIYTHVHICTHNSSKINTE